MSGNRLCIYQPLCRCEGRGNYHDPAFKRWAHAIRAACAEAGHPVDFFASPPGYWWQSKGYLTETPEEATATHRAFHKACLLAEPLLTSYVEPSPRLARMIEESC